MEWRIPNRNAPLHVKEGKRVMRGRSTETRSAVIFSESASDVPGICNDDAVAGSYMGDIDTIEVELEIAITGGKDHIIQFGIHQYRMCRLQFGFQALGCWREPGCLRGVMRREKERECPLPVQEYCKEN